MGYAFNLRLPDELGRRVDRVQEALSKKLGVSMERSKVIRMLLERSLPLLEEELGLDEVQR